MSGKRVIAIVVSIFLLLDSSRVFAFSTDLLTEDQILPGESTCLDEDEYDVICNDSLGRILGNEIEDKAEALVDNGCAVFAAEVNGSIISVDFKTIYDGLLVVAIYDDSGEKLITTGKIDVSRGDARAQLNINDTLPEYFYLRAYLVDYDLEPLSEVYNCPLYTKDMQEFLSKTTKDFDAQNVINLDDDEKNNFLVYKSDVLRIDEKENVVTLISEDDEVLTYCFSDPQGVLSNSGKGQCISYAQSDGNVLIIVVDSIKKDGDRVTISGLNGNVEDVFEYIRLESNEYADESNLDNSNLEEGIKYSGSECVEDINNSITLDRNTDEETVEAIEGDKSKEYVLKYQFIDKELGNTAKKIKINGLVDLKVKLSLKYYFSIFNLDGTYLELKTEFELGADFSVNGSIESTKIPLGRIEFSPAWGVFVRFTPSIIAKMDAEISYSVKIKQTFGFRWDTNSGFSNLTTNPEVKHELKGKVSIFIGISLEPEIVILCDEVANAKLTAEIGAEIKGEYSTKSISDRIHECSYCLDGDIVFKMVAKFNGSLAWDHFKLEKKVDADRKVADWYYSQDYHEGGLGTCPHELYKISLITKDSNNNPLSDVIVKGSDMVVVNNGEKQKVSYVETDGKGQAVVYQRDGKHIVVVSKNGYEEKKNSYAINGSPQNVVIKMKTQSGGGGATDTPNSLTKPIRNSDGTVTYSTVFFGNYWQNDTSKNGMATEDDLKEPIRWRVLSVDGDSLLLLSDKNLDCSPYNETTREITWEKSTVRSWLNGYGASSNIEKINYSNNSGNDSFINSAFSSDERKAIKTVDLENDNNSIWKTNGGNNTRDKVFFLSESDICNTNYGFSSDFIEDSARIAEATFFCECNRADGDSGDKIQWWWLRSPGASADNAMFVDDDGVCHDAGLGLDGYYVSVRPAICIPISSSLYTVGPNIRVGDMNTKTINKFQNNLLSIDVYSAPEETVDGATDMAIYTSGIEKTPGEVKAEFERLEDLKIYNIYAVKDEYAQDILDADNLMYISQVTSGVDGKCSVIFKPKEMVDDLIIFAVPMKEELDENLNPDNLITKEINTENGIYKVCYTSKVYYNGMKHIQKGCKTSKSKVGDIDVLLLDPLGNEIPSSKYRLSFKNNKNAFGNKPPYFNIKLKGKTSKQVKKAFKKAKMYFTIDQMELNGLSLSTPKIKEKKNGSILISKLYYSNKYGKRIKLKQVKKGKGDFYVEKKKSGDIIIHGIYNYKGENYVYRVSSTGEEHGDKINDTVICLDPGHGGEDYGARCDGLTESTINLEISKYTRDYLEKAGFTVVMTRDKDTYVDLEERVVIAKKIRFKMHCFPTY